MTPRTDNVRGVEATIDSAGRIVVPKEILDGLGLMPGMTVDVMPAGTGIQILRVGRTARVVTVAGTTVAVSDTRVTDEIVQGIVDGLRQ